jgi:peroxiredoxin Q/BCP
MNKKAPNFSLLDQNGKKQMLADYLGRWVVVYFYPHDHALGCTKEACDFRDEYRIVEQFGNAAVLGINQASVKSHKRFAAVHQLNFPILSDPGHRITAAFGAWKSNNAVLADKLFGTRRNTYIIDPAGCIVKEYLGVKAANHVQQVIADLQKLQVGSSKAAK